MPAALLVINGKKDGLFEPKEVATLSTNSQVAIAKQAFPSG
jgi:hypothetical protein